MLLIRLSTIAASKLAPDHFNSIVVSAMMISQLMPKMILNLITESGEEAISNIEQRTRNHEQMKSV